MIVIPITLAAAALGLAGWLYYLYGKQKAVSINHALQIIDLHERIDIMESMMEKLQDTHEKLVKIVREPENKTPPKSQRQPTPT